MGKSRKTTAHYPRKEVRITTTPGIHHVREIRAARIGWDECEQ
jgi:hypothetical protein